MRRADVLRDGLIAVPGLSRFLVAGGRDRLRFLNAVTTQELRELLPGAGAYAAMTDDRGHPIADFHVFVLPEVVLIEVMAERSEILRAALEKLVVADDVVLAWAEGAAVSFESEDPEKVARAVDRPAGHLTDPVPGVSWTHDLAGGADLDESSLARFPLAMDVVTRRSQFGAYGASRLTAIASEFRAPAGAHVERDQHAIDALEIAAGRIGDAELSEAKVWSELGVEGAVSFTKGCFPGQEILNRVRSRGEVKRRLVGVRLEGGPGPSAPVPPRGATVTAGDGRAAGRVTRAAEAPGGSGSGVIALAFLARDLALPGTPLLVGDAEHLARVVALPIAAHRPDARSLPWLPAEVA